MTAVLAPPALGRCRTSVLPAMRAAVSRLDPASRRAAAYHLGWIEAHPNLYRFLSQHAYAVRATGAHAADDAKAAFAAELTALIHRYMRALGVDTSPAERIIVGVVGLVDATAAWWLEGRDPPREQLTAELTERVWLLIDYSARELGLRLDPDQRLPKL